MKVSNTSLVQSFLEKFGFVEVAEAEKKGTIGSCWKKYASKHILNDDRARAYCFVAYYPNGECRVMKIGGSNQKDGISNTLNAYAGAVTKNGEAGGTAGGSRYSINRLIRDECLDKGCKVIAYVMFIPKVKYTIIDAYGNPKTIIGNPSFIDQEDECVDAHEMVFNIKPPWNTKELDKNYDNKYELERLASLSKKRKNKEALSLLSK